MFNIFSVSRPNYSTVYIRVENTGSHLQRLHLQRQSMTIIRFTEQTLGHSEQLVVHLFCFFKSNTVCILNFNLQKVNVFAEKKMLQKNSIFAFCDHLNKQESLSLGGVWITPPSSLMLLLPQVGRGWASFLPNPSHQKQGIPCPVYHMTGNPACEQIHTHSWKHYNLHYAITTSTCRHVFPISHGIFEA